MAGFNDDEWGNSSFGDDFDKAFEDDDGFGDSGFNDNNSDFDNSDFGENNEADSNTFENTNLSDSTSNEEPGFVKRNAVKLVIAGVVLIIFVLILGAALSKKKDNIIENTETTVNVETKDVTSDIQSNKNSQASRNNLDTFGSGDWIEIDNEQDVEFNKESTLRFTITEIKHLARKVSVGDRVEVKTVVYGSISGLQGTYQLDVPYDKGKLLNVGNEFDVTVQMGEYKGKPVVGHISY